MSVASTIGKLALGSLIDRGTSRLLNRDKFNKNQFNILTGGGYTGQDEEKDKGPTTLGGIAKTGIMSLIANSSSDSGSNGGGGGSTGSMSASDFSDDTAGTPFRYGGLASLYR